MEVVDVDDLVKLLEVKDVDQNLRKVHEDDRENLKNKLTNKLRLLVPINRREPLVHLATRGKNFLRS